MEHTNEEKREKRAEAYDIGYYYGWHAFGKSQRITDPIPQEYLFDSPLVVDFHEGYKRGFEDQIKSA